MRHRSLDILDGLKPGTVTMRILMIHPTLTLDTGEPNLLIVNAQELLDYAQRLIQLGIDVIWVTSSSTASPLAESADLTPSATDLPATCRHVLPCQTFRQPGLHLYGVDTSIWTEPALQTRLFTFLCLLHSHLPSDVWHTWADGAASFLAVYTACFINAPCVVTYSPQRVNHLPSPTFMDAWIGDHASAIVVPTLDAKHRLLATKHLPTTRQAAIHIIDPASPHATVDQVDLYRQLPHTLSHDLT